MASKSDVPGSIAKPVTALSPAPENRPPATESATRPARVLLVDDHGQNLQALEAILEPLSVETVRAMSAEEVLRRVLSEEFAVILLDVQMPGTDGIEIARLLKTREKSRATPIIFLTALDHDRRRVTSAYQSGAVDYITKPLDPDMLRAKVASFVEMHSRREEGAYRERRRYADAAIKESEERYRLVAMATNDVIWDWNLLTNVQLWNEQAFAVFRYSREEVEDDISWWEDRVHPEDRERVIEGMKAVIADPLGHVWRDEYRFRLGDDSWATFLDRGYVARDGKGKPVRMIGAMQDITERTRAQREAEEARRNAEAARAEAEDANRAKSEFLATMSHELRQPLNAILGYTQLLDMGLIGPVTAEQHDHLEKLRASGIHLLGLVNDVLDLAKVDAGRLSISRSPERAAAAIESAVALIRPQAVERNIQLTFECEPGSDPIYLGDEGRVRQIAINLLSNAVKFTSPGGRVTVSCGTSNTAVPGARLVGSGPWAFIRVTDTGIGIAPEQISSMFEPFVQGDSSYTRPQGGTGLGLSISRRLARLMNGDLGATSRVGVGSTFTLWLPMAAQPAAHEDSQPSIADPTALVNAATGVLQTGDELARFAKSLLVQIDETVDRYSRRIRASGLPHVDSLRETQVRDHGTALLADVLNSIEVVGETRGQAPDLLRDGSEIQRLISDLHGAQRYRLGWSEEDLSKDVQLLRDELEKTITNARKVSSEVREHALDLARRLLRVSEQMSIRGHRFAKSADAR